MGDHTSKLINFLKDYDLEINLITASTLVPNNNIYYNPLNSFNDIFQLLSLLKQLKPDIIILQYVGYSFNKKGIPVWLTLFVKLVKYKQIKLISIIHETYIRSSNRVKTNITSYLQSLCLQSILRSSNVAFTSIDRYLEQCKIYLPNTHLLRIGTNIDPNKILKDSGFHTPYLVLWGDRNHLRALHIFKNLRALNENDLTLKIVGKLSHINLNIITSFLNENDELKHCISLTGILAEHKLSDVLNQSKGILLIENLSNGEGGFTLKSGISVAAIQHQMLIFTNKGDMTDAFLEHNKHLIYLPSSEMGSAKIIIETLNNIDLIKGIKNNLNMIRDHFDWKNIAATIYEHIK